MEIRVPRDRRPAVLQALRPVLGPTRVAPGCLDARLYSGDDGLKAVLLVEQWQSRAEFERSLDREKSMQLLQRLNSQASRRLFGWIPSSAGKE